MTLNKNRIEAFSDGVIAIIITIMVFDLKLPEVPEPFSSLAIWGAFQQLVPKLLAYMLSFWVVAIMWLNHHALFDKLPHVNTPIIWHNIFLLFAMSLIPLPTSFLAAHPMHYQASMFYGAVMSLNAFAFFLLRRYVSVKAKLLPFHKKIHTSNIVGTLLYFSAVPLAFVSVYLSFCIFVAIPLWYVMPKKLHQ